MGTKYSGGNARLTQKCRVTTYWWRSRASAAEKVPDERSGKRSATVLLPKQTAGFSNMERAEPFTGHRLMGRSSGNEVHRRTPAAIRRGRKTASGKSNRDAEGERNPILARVPIGVRRTCGLLWASASRSGKFNLRVRRSYPVHVLGAWTGGGGSASNDELCFSEVGCVWPFRRSSPRQ